MKAVAILGAAGGMCLLLVGVVGYLLGYNYTGASQIHTNLVPVSLFGGAGLLLLTVLFAISRLPEAVPRFPSTLGILALSILAWFFVALYLKQVSGLTAIRADLISWSESPFVDHMIRLRAGQPQFTPPADANGFAYTPGAPLLTYALARLFGHETSVPFFRFIQQGYLVLAALFAAAGARQLLRFCSPGGREQGAWLLFWLPFLFLVATNPTTNVFVHTLHTDALVLATNAIAFWLLVKHAVTQDDRWLFPMGLLPALGFLAKQKEAIWALLYVVYLLLSGRVGLRRGLLFAVTALGLVGLSMGLCYALWGEPYLFWTFQSLSSKHVALKKTLEQFTNSGWYVGIGLFGGAVLLRRDASRRLLPIWSCWLLLLLASTYTSGMAYRPAHLGPASLIAGIWFVVALATIWPDPAETLPASAQSERWLRAVFVAGAVLVLCLSGGFVRTGCPVPRDMDRYLTQIEKEFDGVMRDRVLLDYGSWVYLPGNVVMKDRGSPIAVLIETGWGDFSATIERIRRKQYDKIIMRRLGEGDAEGQSLSMDPGIRQALLENYREARVIARPDIPRLWLHPFLLPDRSVLEPIAQTESPARAGAPANSPTMTPNQRFINWVGQK